MSAFEFGKVAQIIFKKSEQGLNDFYTKFNEIISQQKDKSMPATRSPSKVSHHKNTIEQKNLEARKKKLLKQLQSVDNEIRKTKVQQSRVQKKKTQIDYDPELFNRAADLVARMNQKRKQKSIIHQKQEQKMQLRVQCSLKKFNQLKQIKQKEQQQKRQQIEERIQKRKQKFKVLQQFSKRSNNLIKQLQSYRVSLPNINHFRNPQENDTTQQRQGEEKLNRSKSPKPYPKSSFLELVQKQQLNKKRQEYIKSYEKKKIRQRQQMYGKKVRKNLKQSSLFVTD